MAGKRKNKVPKKEELNNIETTGTALAILYVLFAFFNWELVIGGRSILLTVLVVLSSITIVVEIIVPVVTFLLKTWKES